MKVRYLFIPLLLLCGAPSLRAQKIIIIANRSAKVEEIGISDLRGIFLGSSTRFKNGVTAVPVLLRSGPEHDDFLAEYVGKVDSSFRTVWRSLVFTGVASMPKNTDSDAAMVAYVASTPGAIGYVSKNSPHDNVTTVAVK
ncbi:phosphate ABC transporter substrate-binding protein, PhoT family [Granulicella rosea]|uniref:Phosphate ABC transporter substrate-binding protein, PhoT family n=1 Tax=Granulicella rosea TaxID=474952 RepID=A0A239J4I2_9BACT|nr:hypothetical protein [Granulicella rosea]SNT00153.1 phosphate ABC transporter substrate-binding protein, PhoT family [Granulicella rosea]